MERPWITSPSYEAALRIIIAARQDSGLSQRALADALGKPRSFVSKIENRERRLDFVEFIAVAEALSLDPSKLMVSLSSALDRPLQI